MQGLLYSFSLGDLAAELIRAFLHRAFQFNGVPLQVDLLSLHFETQLAHLNGAIERGQEIIDLQGFADIVIGAEAQCLNGKLIVISTGD